MSTVTQKKQFSIKAIVSRVGLPTLIIACFLVFVLILASFVGESVPVLISDTIKRFGMNGVLVLAMVPAIQSGTGPNFALPLGVVSGLLAIVIAIELNFTGISWLLAAGVMAIFFAGIVGFVYGHLLNAVKGSEMTIATYTGFSFVALMCLVWLMVPFKNPKMGWFIGKGLRETIQLDVVGGAQILNNFLGFSIGTVYIPTGMLLVFAVCCVLVWLFFRSKTGIAISAGGNNPMFAKAVGLNVDRSRVTANMLSTILGALGIIIYSQSYGYAQIYMAPLYMAFPAVAAVLIGGASASRAKVFHVILGTFLFQGLMTTALPVANRIFVGTDLSEMVRAITQNGIILYALTKVKAGDR